MPKKFIDALRDRLLSRGFKRSEYHGQLILERQHDGNACIRVRIYTGYYARSGEQKSVKVCTLHHAHRNPVGIGRFDPIVLRSSKAPSDEATSADVEDVLAVARQAYARGTEWMEEKKEKRQGRHEKQARGGFARVTLPKTPLDGI